MDVVVLARMQFAANITFHILFPSISIALGWVLLLFRLKHLRATDPQQKLDVAYTGFSYRVFRGKTIELDYA